MGSRGNFSPSGNLIKKEYETLHIVDGVEYIKFIKNGSSVKEPDMSTKPNAVYVTLKDTTKDIFDPLKLIKHFTKYDKNREKEFTIDFAHPHLEEQPHVHLYKDNKRLDLPAASKNLKYQQIIESVIKEVTKKYGK
jgi:hypothetical protein